MLRQVICYCFANAQYLCPQRFLTCLAGFIANCRVRFIKNLLIKGFIRFYAVNMDEASSPLVQNYPDFNSFFTRKLATNARVIDSHPKAIIAPADGQVYELGSIHHQQLLQAKGKRFHLVDLLGGDERMAKTFSDGQFITIYLAPKDYHRVHMPYSGRLLKTIYVPGRLFSVNPCTTRQIPGIFAKNERLITLFETDVGEMAVILVGAMIVGSINTQWAGQMRPSSRHAIHVQDYQASPIALNRGEELGHFALGSTVIVLFPEKKQVWSPEIKTGHLVKMGQRIGDILL
jgi:phosphatidylserine decarboxylase